MAFNFKQAAEEATQDLKANRLSAIILAPSGGGKSYLMGTLGVKTLYLYTTGEDHGPKAARKAGGELVTPICLDYAEDKTLSPDEAYVRLLEILSDADGIKEAGFQAVAVDGATEIEAMIRGTTKWRQLCTTDKGTHNGFAEPAATLLMFRPIMNALKNLQRALGIHALMSCILDVKAIAENGEIIESQPRLVGFSVAEGLVQQFGDVIVVGRMSKGDKVQHRLQFLAGVKKESKDAKGVKKTINFHPRLAGLSRDDLPSTMNAALGEVVTLKTEKSA